jgi:hypothetical protein
MPADNASHRPSADKPKFMRGLFLWLQQVAADRALPPMGLHVATALASFVNQRTGDAWPTQETLANMLSITTRAVQRNIAELVERGHLEVVISRGWHRPNSYRPIWKDRTSAPGLEPGDTTPASGLDDGRHDASVGSPTRKTRRARRLDTTPASLRHDARRHLDTTPASYRTIERTIERTTEGTIDSAHARESDPPDRDLLGDRQQKPATRDRQQKPATRQRSATTRKRATPKAEPEGFDEFYRVYPRHVARGTAERAYSRIIAQGGATPAELLNGAMRYAAERTGEPERFTKHPATWLNGQCWKDAPAASAGRPKTNAEKLMEQCGLVARGPDDEEIEQ